jgi:hypothetical protein
LFGFVILLKWKNKKFGIVMKHRSLLLGEGEGGRDQSCSAGVFKLDRVSEKRFAVE